MLNAKEKEFYEACKKGNSSSVTSILEETALMTTDDFDPNKKCVLNVKFKGEISQQTRNSFLIACEFGQVDVIKILLSNPRIKLNFIATDEDTNPLHVSPLHLASRYGRKEIVALLLADPRIDINKRVHHRTALFFACLYKHTEIVSLFLADKKFDETPSSIDDISSFYMACEEGHAEIVKLFLENNKADVNSVLKDGSIPLHVACQNGHAEVVKILLQEKGVDINRMAEPGLTPLIMACYKNHENIVALLLEDKRLVINQIGLKDKNAFELTCEWKNKKIFNQFLKHYLVETIFSNPNQTPEEMLKGLCQYYRSKHALDINSTLCSDILILYNKAVSLAVFALVIFISDGLLKLTPLNKEAQRFFSIANRIPFELKSLLCLRLGGMESLISSKKSEPFFRALAKRYDLHCAMSRNDNLEVDFILAQKEVQINPNQQSAEGVSLLFAACASAYEQVVVRLLSDPRMEVNIELEDGKTPLFIACELGDVTIVPLLLNDDRVDFTKPLPSGVTPFIEAYSQGHSEIVSFLLNKELTCIKQSLTAYCRQNEAKFKAGSWEYKSPRYCAIKNNTALFYHHILSDDNLTSPELLLITYSLFKFCKDELLKSTVIKDTENIKLSDYCLKRVEKFNHIIWNDVNLSALDFIANEISCKAQIHYSPVSLKGISGSLMLKKLFEHFSGSKNKVRFLGY